MMINRLKKASLLFIRMLLTIYRSVIKSAFNKEKIPPLFIPISLLKSYTMNGKARIRYWYHNELSSYVGPVIYEKDTVDGFITRIKNRETFYYKKTDSLLYEALEKYSINNMEVAIMGSTKPIYESMCVAYGGKPTTIEYNKIISEDSRIKTMTVEEYDKNPVKFDAAFSISSFEHDGLGRYGDPLNPYGDFLAMNKMKSVLKPNTLFFLSVPVGRDAIVWNAHRIYGKFRLPLLLKGWQIIDTYGFSEDSFLKKSSQPVFVLKNIDQSMERNEP